VKKGDGNAKRYCQQNVSHRKEEEEIGPSDLVATPAPEARHGPLVVWQCCRSAVFRRISIL